MIVIKIFRRKRVDYDRLISMEILSIFEDKERQQTLQVIYSFHELSAFIP